MPAVSGEIRCGAIETLDGLQTVPAMVEYVMNKEMPIRTVTDKISVRAHPHVVPECSRPEHEVSQRRRTRSEGH